MSAVGTSTFIRGPLLISLCYDNTIQSRKKVIIEYEVIVDTMNDIVFHHIQVCSDVLHTEHSR